MLASSPPLLTPTLRTGLAISLLVHAALGIGMTCYHHAAPTLAPERERFIEVVFMESTDASEAALATAATEQNPALETPAPSEQVQPQLADQPPTPEPKAESTPSTAPAAPEPEPIATVEPTPISPTPPKPEPERAPTPLPQEPTVAPIPLRSPLPTAPSSPQTIALPPSGEPSNVSAQSSPQKPSAGLRSRRAAPLYRRNPEPPYPALARRRRQEGTVLLLVTVTAQGRASTVRVHTTSGFPGLDQAAANAVRTWEFEPARDGEVAIESEIEVPVRFQLDGTSRR